MIRIKKYIVICLPFLLLSNILFSQTQLSDQIRGLLFFINRYSGVERCKTLDSERNLLRPWNDLLARGLAIGPIKKHIYWTDWVRDKIHNTKIKGLIISIENNTNFWTNRDLINKPYVS